MAEVTLRLEAGLSLMERGRWGRDAVAQGIAKGCTWHRFRFDDDGLVYEGFPSAPAALAEAVTFQQSRSGHRNE